MNFTILYLAFLILSSIYRVRRLLKSYVRKGSERVEVRKSISYSIMLFLYLSIFIGAILEYFYSFYIIGGRKINLLVSCLGFLMYVGVIPFRDSAIRHLGRFMSPDIEIKEDHRLIKSGPYSYIRHPLSLCVILEVIGLTLIPNSYLFFIIALIVFVPIILYRIHQEEKALIVKFGQAYLDYRKEVYALLPIKKVK